MRKHLCVFLFLCAFLSLSNAAVYLITNANFEAKSKASSAGDFFVFTEDIFNKSINMPPVLVDASGYRFINVSLSFESNAFQHQIIGISSCLNCSFHFHSFVSTSLIRNCYFEGGDKTAIIYEGAQGLEVENSNFTNQKQGAIFSTNSLKISNSTFNSNSGQKGVIVHNSTTEFKFQNSSVSGTVGCTAIYSNSTNFSVYNSSFQMNQDKAIIANNGGQFTNCSFLSNSGGNDDLRGGAVLSNEGLTIDFCRFENNGLGNSDGGAIYVSSFLNLNNSQFYQNKGRNGGSVYSLGITQVGNCNFTSNGADFEGGAIRLFLNGTISQSSFQNNSAQVGGAIHSTFNLVVDASDFFNNTAKEKGGAFYMTKGRLTLVNVENNAADEGGAIYAIGDVDLSQYVGGGNEGKNASVMMVCENCELGIIQAAFGKCNRYYLSKYPAENGRKSYGPTFFDVQSFHVNVTTSGQSIDFPTGSSLVDLDSDMEQCRTINESAIRCNFSAGVGRDLTFPVGENICTYGSYRYSYIPPEITSATASLDGSTLVLKGTNFGFLSASTFVQLSNSTLNGSCVTTEVQNSTYLALSGCHKFNYTSVILSVGNQLSNAFEVAFVSNNETGPLLDDIISIVLKDLVNGTVPVNQITGKLNDFVSKIFENTTSNIVTFSSPNISLTAFDIRRISNLTAISLNLNSTLQGKSSVPLSILQKLSRDRNQTGESSPAFIVFSTFVDSQNQFVIQDETKRPTFTSDIYGLSVIDSGGFVVNLEDSEEPISIQMEISSNLTQTEREGLECLFWNETSLEFSSSGCSKNLVSSPSGTYLLECLCNHLTNFTSAKGLPTPSSSALQTTEDPRKGSDINIGLIVGVVAGGVALILILIIVIILVLRKKSRNVSEIETELYGTVYMEEAMNSKVKVNEEIGKGAFSTVYKATFNETTIVVIKKIKSNGNKKQFIREANILKSLHHPNIVQYLGLFEDDEGLLNLMVEYMVDGNLLNMLQTKHLSPEVKMKIFKNIASALRYLEDQRIVHNDIAARNVLMSGTTAKLSDFGISLNTRMTTSLILDKSPIRWSAPEVLDGKPGTHASDAWSFAVLIWEVLNDGIVPYGEKDNGEVSKYVKEGGRLSHKEIGNEKLEKIMSNCWNAIPKDRPSFANICLDLETYKERATSEIHSRPMFPISNSSGGNYVNTYEE